MRTLATQMGPDACSVSIILTELSPSLCFVFNLAEPEKLKILSQVTREQQGKVVNPRTNVCCCDRSMESSGRSPEEMALMTNSTWSQNKGGEISLLLGPGSLLRKRITPILKRTTQAPQWFLHLFSPLAALTLMSGAVVESGAQKHSKCQPFPQAAATAPEGVDRHLVVAFEPSHPHSKITHSELTLVLLVVHIHS